MRRLLFAFLMVPFLVLGQTSTRTIHGTIYDASTGETLIGATIFLDPENEQAKSYVPQGTISDLDGKFKFTFPSYVKRIVVSYMGYETYFVHLTKYDSYEIKLRLDAHQLEEAVVTGYQKMEARKVTSAVQTVALGDIERKAIASVDQMLEGQVAGLSSIPSNGGPGAPMKLRVRSTVSLSGSSEPLWVLDGMILEGNDIPSNYDSQEDIDELYNTSIAGVNPSDIESITVLKDAAATAIYGAKAANGVIIVTTKKGTVGKPRINFSAATFYTEKPNLSKLNMMNATEKVDFELAMASRKDLTYRNNTGEISRILASSGEKDAFLSQGLNGLTSETLSSINYLRGINTNWGDVIYQNAINQQYNLSISGGSEKTTYYFSAGYYDEQGTTKSTSYDRFNMTMKVDFNLLKNLQLGTSLFFSQSNRESYISDLNGHTNPAKYSRTANPYLPVYNSDGSYVYDKDIEGYSDTQLDFNFAEEMANTDYSLTNRSIKPMITLDYEPYKWLHLSAQLAMQMETSSTEKLALKETYYVRQYRERSRTQGKYILPDGGVIQNWESSMDQYQARFQAEYKKRIFDFHELDVMAGYEMRGNTFTEVHTKGFGYDPKSLTTESIVFPEGSTLVDQSAFKQYQRRESEDRFLSYYMTASYTYDERFTLFGSARYDGSNMFGVDRKYKYLPLWSASAAWNIGREYFIRDISWISAMKLRLSYGIQGNVDKNTSPYVVGEWGSTSILPDNTESSVIVTSPPNPYLRWERTSSWNAGIDFSVLKNRITLNVDAYHRVSDDLIGMRDLPGENGYIYSSMNWAKLTNKGIEVSLSTVNIKTPDFRWTSNLNFAHNVSKINRMSVRNDSYEPSRVGYSVGAMFALKTDGLDENGLPIFISKTGERKNLYDYFKMREGSIMGGLIPYLRSDLSAAEYRDLFYNVGSSEPKLTGGFSNRFSYKNWDLAIVTNFTIGQTVQESPFYHPTRVIPGQNYSKRMKDIWSPSNRNGKYPGLLGTTTEGEKNWGYMWLNEMDPASSFYKYDIWYKTLSYLRVNSIRLGYSLPQVTLDRLHIAGARFSVEAKNPFVFGTNYDGYFDPETYGNVYAQPIAKTYSVGLDLTF